MTHPFHPFSGREFELLILKHSERVGDRVYFYDDAGEVVSVPAGWTSVAGEDPFVVMSGGKALFRVEDLLRLADLLVGLKEEI